MQPVTGGRVVVETLASLGLTTIFSVSGNQVLAIFDAAPEAGIRIVHMRHESASAYAAAAYAEMTGGPGVMLSSAGPGHIAGFTGIAVAASMELPLICLSGGSPFKDRGRGAFQEIDQNQLPLAVCKAAFDVTDGDTLAATLYEAVRVATTGIPGPVHVTLPSDILNGTTSVTGATPVTAPEERLSAADEAQLAKVATLLSQARRPLVIARPSVARGASSEPLDTLCAILGIGPVITECPRALSDLKYIEIISDYPDSDFVLLIGPADFTVGYLSHETIARDGIVALIDAPGDPKPNRSPDVHLQVNPRLALEYIIEHLPDAGQVETGWAAHWPIPGANPELPDVEKGLVHPLQVALAVRDFLTPDDLVVLDGGEFCQWMRLGLRDAPCPVLWSGKLGAIGGAISMGVGVRASGFSGQLFVAAGDGGAGYHIAEIETAARNNLPMTVIVGNDALWAAEWHQQVSRYGVDRTFETSLLPARYDLVATGYGGVGTLVTDDESLYAAIADTGAENLPALLNVRVAPLPSPAAIH